MAERVTVLGCYAGFAVLLVACGGKTTSEDASEGATSASSAASGASNGEAATPGCQAICAHVVGACAAGASTEGCVRDCQITATDPQCPKERDAYLSCMLTVQVQCSARDIVIVGCSEERVAYEKCDSGA